MGSPDLEATNTGGPSLSTNNVGRSPEQNVSVSGVPLITAQNDSTDPSSLFSSNFPLHNEACTCNDHHVPYNSSSTTSIYPSVPKPRSSSSSLESLSPTACTTQSDHNFQAASESSSQPQDDPEKSFSNNTPQPFAKSLTQLSNVMPISPFNHNNYNKANWQIESYLNMAKISTNSNFIVYKTDCLQKLEYNVYKYSSYSQNYHPKNILVTKPDVQSSRWSSASNDRAQFILLRLKELSIVQAIILGKYHKAHVCNLKEFKVFGGLEEDSLEEMLHAGLINDSEPETFRLRPKHKGPIYPCEFIKIVPLQTWGVNFSFSIWHVELRGINHKEVVQKCYNNYIEERETEAIRICLKHLRERDRKESFEVLQRTSNVVLEHTLLTKMYDELVKQGNFENVEKLLVDGKSIGLFDEYVREEEECEVIFNRIDTSIKNPSPRGGHQMCIDEESGTIYLFGGWDGYNDLSDFWSFDSKNKQWTCISEDTRLQNGPAPRSCHKICFDQLNKQIYILGRYSEPTNSGSVTNDFWSYDVVNNKWISISMNTAKMRGPDLVHDHQMIIDSEKQNLYVFGGKIQNSLSRDVYLGLYRYSITSGTWDLIFSNGYNVRITSRIGHSMLFNKKSRELYIFAGQNNNENLTDFYVFELDTEKLYTVSKNYVKQGGPDPGLAHRSVLDSKNDCIYVISGLNKNKHHPTCMGHNHIWSYNIKTDVWKNIHKSISAAVSAEYEPAPRFAYQVVFDPVGECIYLFGGNPGVNLNPNLRLNDFWQITLKRSSISSILSKAIFKTRTNKFRELCNASNPNYCKARALRYLRLKISCFVPTLSRINCRAQFQRLIMEIYKPQDTVTQVNSKLFNDLMKPSRAYLYQSLLKYFPTKLKQPDSNLINLVKFT